MHGILSYVSLLTKISKYSMFVLRFNSPFNNFSVMSRRGYCFLGINQYSRELMCLAQGHNKVPQVGSEPRTFRFGPMLYHYATKLPSRKY